MIASSANLEAGIFLMDKGKFREYSWHWFVLRHMIKTNKLSQN